MLQYVPAELQQLHQYLELEFNPLLLCKRISPILEGLESDEVLKEYAASLRETTLIRLIKEVCVFHSVYFCQRVICLHWLAQTFPQVSQVYETIELSRLSELAAFANATDLERVVVNTARSNGIQVWHML